MRVAIIGGTGFVGGYLVDALVASGHQPVLMVRPGAEKRVRHARRCIVVPGDVEHEDRIRETFAGSDAAIYNVGILRERPERGVTFDALQHRGAKRAVDAAVDVGVPRFVLMSANGVKLDGTPYQRTKYLAEQHLRATRLAYTIFRPSVVFGDPRGGTEFCTQLRDEVIDMPVPAPLFFDGLNPGRAGRFALSPVHVRDVAAAVIGSLAVERTIGETYALGGPEAIEWRDIVRIVAAACGKTKVAVPIPALHVRLAAAVFERFAFFPLTRDQLTMLMEGNTCDSRALFELLGITPARFDERALSYLGR